MDELLEEERGRDFKVNKKVAHRARSLRLVNIDSSRIRSFSRSIGSRTGGPWKGSNCWRQLIAAGLKSSEWIVRFKQRVTHVQDSGRAPQRQTSWAVSAARFYRGRNCIVTTNSGRLQISVVLGRIRSRKDGSEAGFSRCISSCPWLINHLEVALELLGFSGPKQIIANIQTFRPAALKIS